VFQDISSFTKTYASLADVEEDLFNKYAYLISLGVQFIVEEVDLNGDTVWAKQYY
jgi:hypothetical protein